MPAITAFPWNGLKRRTQGGVRAAQVAPHGARQYRRLFHLSKPGIGADLLSPLLLYDLRKMKAHGLVERDGKRYACLLSEKGTKVALTFVLFHQRLSGPLANSLFHHQPNSDDRSRSKLEAAYRNYLRQVEQSEIC